MANMSTCHHSGGKSPLKPTDGKSVPSGAMSCCPLEVTIAPKWDAAKMGIAPGRRMVLDSNVHLVAIPFYDSVELRPSVWHSGRDTLLNTGLLRI
jgi:hypothetical protein